MFPLIVSTFIFEKESLSLNPELTSCLDWLGIELQEPFCLHDLSAEVTDMTCPSFTCALDIQEGSLRSHSTCFPDRAISPAPIANF